MICLIQFLAGPFTQWSLVYFFEIVEMLFAAGLYALNFTRRRYFLLRLTGGLLGCFGAAFLFGAVRTRFPGLLTNILLLLLLYVMIYGFLTLCCRGKPAELAFCVCTGMCTWMIVGRLYTFILMFAGRDSAFSVSPFSNTHSDWDWLVFLLIRGSIAFLISMPIRRRDARLGEESSQLVIAFSVSITVITTAFETACRYYDAGKTPLSHLVGLFIIIYGVVVLLLRTGILAQSQRRQELAVLNELLRSEKSQYESIRQEMDLISLKCHDLRHQLAGIQGRLTGTELASLQSAVELYDANIKTGCDVLDMILFKMRLYCRQQQIKITCAADGASLSGLSSIHLYSLLSNAIGNAVEAAAGVEEVEKRTIGIVIGREGALAAIHVTNYFSGAVTVEDGLPVTSKREDHHGYGFKSMRHIAGLYQGDVRFRTDGDLFFLDIYFPLEESDLSA